jgi:hypothetical protein
MSFEDTPTQVAPAVSDTPVKKRGRPAGVKNKKTVAKKPVAKDAAVDALAHKLSYAQLHINKLEDDYKKLQKRFKTEVDGLLSIVSYLEYTLKETWQEEAIDAASV